MTCPTDEALAQMASGALYGAEALEHHLDGCGSCRTLLGAVVNGSAPYAPPERALLKSGEKLGRYEIEKLLAAGGMGMLYAARDPHLNRRVVLKLMRPAFGGELGRVRLLREAQAMASLSHPNVVSVFELGESGDRVFVAMELVEGGTLRDWMKSPGTWKDVLWMMVLAGDGLAAAHRAGVVHRDFKPENVLVGTDGRPRVGDFGLARPELVAEEEPPRNLPMKITHTGTMLGTPAYMSPEQLAGKPADARSDQYSFCVTLYEALTGKRPFPSESLEQLRAHVAGGMPPPPKDGPVPAQVWAALAKGLQPNPAHRFPDMESLLEVLSASQGAAHPGQEGAGGVAAVRRRGALYAAIVTPLVLMLGGGVAVWVSGQASQAQGPQHAPRPGPAEIRGRGPELPKQVDLAVGARRVIPFDDAMRIAIGDADVAKVELVGDGVRIEGLLRGKTSLIVWTGTERYESNVTVTERLPETIALDPATQKVLDVPGLERVAVGDAAIADFKTTGDQIRVMGVAKGRTTLLAWSSEGRRSWFVEVGVSPQSPSTYGPPDPGPPPDKIDLEPGLTQTMHVPGLTRVAVMNGAVAAFDQSDGDITLTGTQSGLTTLLIWTGEQRRAIPVRVAWDHEVLLRPKAKQVLDTPDVQRIAIGDTDVADVKVVGPGKVEVTARRAGRTTLLLWDGDSRDTYQVTVLSEEFVVPAVIMAPEETWEVPVQGVTRCSSSGPGVAKVHCVDGKVRIRSGEVGQAALQSFTRNGGMQIFDVRVQFF